MKMERNISMNEYQLIKTAKEIKGIDPNKAASILLQMNNMDARCVLWLADTGKCDTITITELKKEREIAKKAFRNKL